MAINRKQSGSRLTDRNAYRFYIGIDTGTKTGFAIWDRKERKLICCKTLPIHRALEELEAFRLHHYLEGGIFVRVEDARKRKVFKGVNMAARQQGAGSIKRDAVIWEDFLKDKNYSFEMLAPANTKMDEATFKGLTKWQGTTSEHSRDAAVRVYGL